MKTSLLTLLVVLALFGIAQTALKRGPWTNGIIRFAEFIGITKTIDTNGTNGTDGTEGSNRTKGTNTVDQSTIHQYFIEKIAKAKWYQNVKNIIKQMIEERRDSHRGFWSIFHHFVYFWTIWNALMWRLRESTKKFAFKDLFHFSQIFSIKSEKCF